MGKTSALSRRLKRTALSRACFLFSHEVPALLPQTLGLRKALG